MRSSAFVNHSYDYRPNWTPLSPVTITYTLLFGKYSTVHDYPSDNSLTYRHLEQASRLKFISVHMMFFWLVLQVSPSLLLKIKFTKQFTLLFTESFSKIFFKKLINPSILLVSAVHSLQSYVPW